MSLQIKNTLRTAYPSTSSRTTGVARVLFPGTAAGDYRNNNGGLQQVDQTKEFLSKKQVTIPGITVPEFEPPLSEYTETESEASSSESEAEDGSPGKKKEIHMVPKIGKTLWELATWIHATGIYDVLWKRHLGRHVDAHGEDRSDNHSGHVGENSLEQNSLTGGEKTGDGDNGVCDGRTNNGANSTFPDTSNMKFGSTDLSIREVATLLAHHSIDWQGVFSSLAVSPETKSQLEKEAETLRQAEIRARTLSDTTEESIEFEIEDWRIVTSDEEGGASPCGGSPASVKSNTSVKSDKSNRSMGDRSMVNGQNSINQIDNLSDLSSIPSDDSVYLSPVSCRSAASDTKSVSGESVGSGCASIVSAAGSGVAHSDGSGSAAGSGASQNLNKDAKSALSEVSLASSIASSIEVVELKDAVRTPSVAGSSFFGDGLTPDNFAVSEKSEESNLQSRTNLETGNFLKSANLKSAIQGTTNHDRVHDRIGERIDTERNNDKPNDAPNDRSDKADKAEETKSDLNTGNDAQTSDAQLYNILESQNPTWVWDPRMGWVPAE